MHTAAVTALVLGAAVTGTATAAPGPRLSAKEMASVRAWAGAVQAYVNQTTGGTAPATAEAIVAEVRACPIPVGPNGKPLTGADLFATQAGIIVLQSVVSGAALNRDAAAATAAALQSVALTSAPLRRWRAAQARYINQTVILGDAATPSRDTCAAMALVSRSPNITHARVLPLLGAQPTPQAVTAFATISAVVTGSSPGTAFRQGYAYLVPRGMPRAAAAINQVPDR
jgi:hypothetical protein